MTDDLSEWSQQAFDEQALDRSGRTGKPVIKLRLGKLSELASAAEATIIQAGLLVYQYGGVLVRPGHGTIRLSDGAKATGARLIPLSLSAIIDNMAQAADYEKWNEKKEQWTVADPPRKIAEIVLSRQGLWDFPVLSGLIQAPTLRVDGTVLETKGYDYKSGLYFDGDGVNFPRVPQKVTKDDCIRNMKDLIDLLSEFPFATEIDRSVAISAFLSSLVRPALLSCPMHAFTAPQASSGKSLLVDMVSVLTTGQRAAVVSQGRTAEELEKRLGASLIAGDRIVSIDNIEQPLGHDVLCQALTQSMVSIRLLGQSSRVTVPSGSMFFATGNNLVLMGDMSRRALVCKLDAKMERPEQRIFSRNPLQVLHDHRESIAISALAILRGYLIAGSPPQGVPPLASFDRWSSLVRNALLWLGLPDPVQTQDAIRQSTPEIELLSALLHHWQTRLSYQAWRAQDLVKKAEGAWEGFSRDEDLFIILSDICANNNGTLNVRRLGRYLAKHQGMVVDGMSLRCKDYVQRVGRWVVDIVPEQS